jgi:selenium binding protein SBP56
MACLLAGCLRAAGQAGLLDGAAAAPKVRAKGGDMPFWKPDPTFYPSARLAMQAPAERLAFLATLNPSLSGAPDALCVVDVDPGSPSYSQVVGRVDMPNAGDELHHFGWNACSSALCPYAPHPHVERRYLVVPGLRSSRIHIALGHAASIALAPSWRPACSRCSLEGRVSSGGGAPEGWPCGPGARRAVRAVRRPPPDRASSTWPRIREHRRCARR